MAEADTRLLTLNGVAPQTMSGTQTYFTRILAINNPAASQISGENQARRQNNVWIWV